jgi:CHAT domain-containing protein
MWTSPGEAAHTYLAILILVVYLSASTFAAAIRTDILLITQPTQSDVGRINTAREAENIQSLQPDKPVKKELAGGQAHKYQVSLAAGDYLHVVVYQRGIDVVVTLFDTNGAALVNVNRMDGTQAPELLLFIAETTGAYSLEVRSRRADTGAGRYEIMIRELRTATLQDKRRVAADRAFIAAEQLRVEETTESLASAVKKYEEVLPIWQALGERGREAFTLHRIGAVYDFVGDQQRALDFYSRARVLMHAEGEPGAQAYLLIDIGWSYYQLGDNEKALELYKDALPLMRAAGEPSGEALTLNRIGVVYTSLQENRKALEFHSRALPLMRSVSNRNGEAYTLAHIGSIYHYLGDERKALETHQQALDLIKTTEDRSGTAYMLSNVASAYYYLGDMQKSVSYYRQALQLSQSTGDRPGQAQLHYKTARILREGGNLIEARSQVEAALKIIESLRTSIGSQQLRVSYFSTVQQYYEFYVELLMSLHRQNPSGGFDAAALEASEHARARSLIELLIEAHAHIRQGVDPALIEKEAYLQRQLNARAETERRLLSAGHKQEQAVEMAREINALITQYQEVWDQIRTRSLRYAALAQPQSLSVREIQQQVLDTNTLLLEYWLGKERSYLWAVGQNSIASYELPKRADINAAVQHFYDLLTAARRKQDETDSQYRARVAKAESDYPAAAAELSKILLVPASSQLEKKRLLIVANGSLEYLPFAALASPTTLEEGSLRARGKSTAPGFHMPLIFEHEIVNLPSASTLAVLRRELAHRLPATKAVAVLADPVFDRDDPRIKPGRNHEQQAVTGQSRRTELESAIRDVELRDSAGKLSRLPFSRDEAKAIFNLVPSEQALKATDFQASLATATSGELSKYRIVHFATHGLLNSQHPELSGIVLSLVDEKGEQQDGFLRLHEIYNLNLPAELVVLSACRTGLGKQVKGEGLIGLTRGFMYAGAKLVMASLWNIDDSVTPELMKQFYEGMFTKGMPPAAALRAAQIHMWQTRHRKSPYYWAAFVLQGDWR